MNSNHAFKRRLLKKNIILSFLIQLFQIIQLTLRTYILMQFQMLSSLFLGKRRQIYYRRSDQNKLIRSEFINDEYSGCFMT